MSQYSGPVALDPASFAAGEPTNGAVETCVVLSVGPDEEEGYYDMLCSDEFKCVCEIL